MDHPGLADCQPVDRSFIPDAADWQPEDPRLALSLAVLDHIPGFFSDDGCIRLAHSFKITYDPGADDGWIADLCPAEPAGSGAHLYCGDRSGVFFGIMGHHQVVLDVLHASNAAFIRRFGAWDGSGCFLVGCANDTPGVDQNFGKDVISR